MFTPTPDPTWINVFASPDSGGIHCGTSTEYDGHHSSTSAHRLDLSVAVGYDLLRQGPEPVNCGAGWWTLWVILQNLIFHGERSFSLTRMKITDSTIPYRATVTLVDHRPTHLMACASWRRPWRVIRTLSSNESPYLTYSFRRNWLGCCISYFTLIRYPDGYSTS